MIAADALPATGLVQPGSLIDYSYRLRLAPGITKPRGSSTLRRRFPEAGWRIREPGQAAPNLARLLDRVSLFLTLVGLTALLVGGVGIANAVRAYLATKTADHRRDEESWRVAAHRVHDLSFANSYPGGARHRHWTGARRVDSASGTAFCPERPGANAAGHLPGAAGSGRLVRSAHRHRVFAVAGRERLRDRTFALFRASIEPPSAAPRWPYRIATCVAALLLAGLAVASVDNRDIALWFLSGAAGSLVLFRLVAHRVDGVGAAVHPRGIGAEARPRQSLSPGRADGRYCCLARPGPGRVGR